MHLTKCFVAVFIYRIVSLLQDSADASVTGISFEGCFKNLSNYATIHNLSDKNDPRNCYEVCNKTQYIGLQKQDCFCNATRGSRSTENQCNYVCPGDNNYWCGSNNTFYLYYYTDLKDFNVDGDFGVVSLRIVKNSGDIHYNYLIQANTVTDKHYSICYDPFGRCNLAISSLPEVTWQDAKSKCFFVHSQGLIPYSVATNEAICPPVQPDRTYWVGMTWFQPATTSTSATTTMTKITSSTVKITSTTSDLTHSLNPATTTMLNNNSAPTSDGIPIVAAPTSDGIPIVAVAVSVAVIVAIAAVALLFILFIKKRKKLCFKGSDTMFKNNAVSPQEIPELNTQMDTPSVAPGSTLPPINLHSGRPATVKNRVIQNGLFVQRAGNTETYNLISDGKTQNFLENSSVGTKDSHSEMNGQMQSERKQKKKRKRRQEHKTDRTDNDIYNNINSDLNDVNVSTGHPNSAVQGNETEPKMEDAEEYSCQDNKPNISTFEPGPVMFSDARKENVRSRHNGMSDLPVVEEHPYLSSQILNKDNNKKKETDEQSYVEDRPGQEEGLDLSKVDKEQTNDKSDTKRKKRKKGKKSKKRSKENVTEEHDEIGDNAPNVSGREEYADLQSEESKKKHKRKRKKKDKNVDNRNEDKQDLCLETEENHQMFNTNSPL